MWRFLPLFFLLTGCELFWETIARQVDPPKHERRDSSLLPFQLQDMQHMLDLQTRYMVVQDRRTPDFLHAEWAAFDAQARCQNFAEEEEAFEPLTLERIAEPTRAYVHYENPLLYGGAFIAALALRQDSGVKAQEVRLIRDMLTRIIALSERGPEIGYVLRYDGTFAGNFEPEEACRFPNGACTVIDQGPYASEGEKYDVNALTRRWEPSGDEYVGLLLIFAFVERYIDDPEVRALNRKLAGQVASYLRNHDYYLERPCPDGGIVWRGGYHIVWAHAYERVFERMGLGYHVPHFPTPKEWCERNRLLPVAANAVLPCTPIMMQTYVDELSAVIAAMQPIHNIEFAYAAYTEGAMIPFLRLTGSGPNLIMFVLLAESALFDDVKPKLARFYQAFQLNSPERILPYWHGMYSYSGGDITSADDDVRASLALQCQGEALPKLGNLWSEEVTLRCIFPMTLLAHRAGVAFDTPISSDALPLSYGE